MNYILLSLLLSITTLHADDVSVATAPAEDHDSDDHDKSMEEDTKDDDTESDEKDEMVQSKAQMVVPPAPEAMKEDFMDSPLNFYVPDTFHESDNDDNDKDDDD